MPFPVLLLALISIALPVVAAEAIPYPHSGDDPEQRCVMHIHRPKEGDNLPVVVWFHGGGLTQGQPEIPAELKNQGLVVVAAGYRLSPKVQSPVYIEDAAAAVAWVFQNIKEHGGNPSQIFLSGHSAGGYLASMVGLDQKYLAAHGLRANDLAGLIPYSGQVITHFTIRSEQGIPPLQPVVDSLAPLFHVRKDAPPILITTGDREQELYGRYEENAYFQRMMKLVGHPMTELIEIRGTDHGSMVAPSHPLLLEFVKKQCSKP